MLTHMWKLLWGGIIALNLWGSTLQAQPVGGRIRLLIIDQADTVNFRLKKNDQRWGTNRCISQDKSLRIRTISPTHRLSLPHLRPFIDIKTNEYAQQDYVIELIRRKRDTMRIAFLNFPDRNFCLRIPFQKGDFTLRLLPSFDQENVVRFGQIEPFLTSIPHLGIDITPSDWHAHTATDSTPLLHLPCDNAKGAGVYRRTDLPDSFPYQEEIRIEGNKLYRLRSAPGKEGIFYQEWRYTLSESTCLLFELRFDSLLSVSQQEQASWYWVEPPMPSEEPVPGSQTEPIGFTHTAQSFRWEEGLGGKLLCSPTAISLVPPEARPSRLGPHIFELLPEAWLLDSLVMQYNAQTLPKAFEQTIVLPHLNPVTRQPISLRLSPFTYLHANWHYQDPASYSILLEKNGITLEVNGSAKIPFERIR